MKETIQKRILLLDGAMGTMLQRKGLSGNSEALNLTHPEAIAEIHREYIEAGADIITANTFSANRISQQEYGLQDKAGQLALAGVHIARKVADEFNSAQNSRKVFVAGSVGPTSKSLTLAPDITDPSKRPYGFDDFAEAYREQIEAIINGGADLVIFETCFDALNVKAALYALSQINESREEPFPAIVSVSVSDRSGRTLTGQTLEAFYNSVRHYPLTAFGINCSLGAEDMLPIVKEISSFCEYPVICYPNAGLPNEMGGYNETPGQMAVWMERMAAEGSVNIVGGCCGTTPEHIRAVAEKVSAMLPRKPAERSRFLKVSGLEAVDIDLKSRNFCNVGERTNVAGSRKFARLIASGSYEEALEIAAGQIENGAMVIDINMDDAMLDSTVEMEKFVRWTQNDPNVAKAALMIDSSHWETLLAGLKNAQGKCIVNSISLKDGEEKFIEKAVEINRLGAAMVVMAFDEEGQATTYERKTSICKRAYKLLTDNNIEAENIIFDVNILSIGTGMAEHARYAVDYIEAVRWIKENLPGVRTSGGVSNLSFAFRGNNTVREAMHSVFLYYAIKAGLDMSILNPGMLQIYDEIDDDLRDKVEAVIFDRDEGATERLIAKAQQIMAETNAAKESGKKIVEKTADSPEERLVEALVKGRSNTLAEDVLECYNIYKEAVKVIEGPLMKGMEKVGELFGAGKMFLPQVVKSAKLMRDAVAVLQPYMQTSDGIAADSKPVVISATVKGDVHDIGKNITGIVLGCNGFNVIDLGVMVDKETILEAAVEHNAAIIGASGLITPSLYQMEELCREMSARNMDIPLFIGGATTSALHTAVKLAPLYDHVFYSPDASANAVMAKKYMMDREKFEAEEQRKQQEIRDLYTQKSSSLNVPGPTFESSDYTYIPLESRPAFEIPLEELKTLFDWKMFLVVWGIKYGEQNINNPEITKILEEGRHILDTLPAKAMASWRFEKAYRDEDNCVVADGIGRIPMLRQENGEGLSLCDFLPEKGEKSPFGFFALSVSGQNHIKGCGCPACSNEYDRMMERAVRVTLAEAASEWIEQQIRKQLPDEIRIIKPAAGYAACPDHSLKKDILDSLFDSEKLGISLTESYAMLPEASICGFIIVHRKAAYPEIRKISPEQFESYVSKRGFSEKEARKLLGHLL